MVKISIGNIFESEAHVLVNTVNCVGIMGKGIALEFKKHFPEMYEDYVARCQAKQVRLGQPYLFRQLLPPWVLNFPTKEHWRSVSRLSDIIAGLEFLEQHYQEWGITSLAVPPLGCGNGGLEWRIVGPTLYRHLERLKISVELYAPHGTPKHELETAFLTQATEARPAQFSAETSKINPAWVALVEILDRIDREPYHWPVGRVTFQKLAYFATEAGLPTGLHHTRGSYGPFASDLKPLLARLTNNGLMIEERLGKMFVVKPGPTYQDAARSFQAQLQEWHQIIDRVADLFLRLHTQQAEIAATVFFVAQALTKMDQSQPSENDVLEEVKRWKQRRKPPLADEEIARAIRNLNILRWLDVRHSEQLPLPHEALVDV